MKRRKSSGSMLILVSLSILLITAVFLLAFSFNSLLFKRTSSQYKIDAMALSLASLINAGDRVGQVNELEASSRELVYVSRRRVDDCLAQDVSFMAPLCMQLLDEARAGQVQVERERRNLVAVTARELQEQSLRHNAASTSNGPFSLAWMQASEPTIVRVDIGRLTNIESNVTSLDVLSELSEFDCAQGYVQPATKLFKADTNARLPAPDGDLDFKLSGLPACVDGTCSPARNVNSQVFKASGTVFENGGARSFAVEQIPNAVQVFGSMDTALGGTQKYQASVTLVSTATTNGAITASRF